MGQTHSTPQQQTYPSTLHFVQSTSDPHFSLIDIYRTKQAPYEYIMDFKKNYIEENDRTQKHLRLMQQLKNMDHKNIAKIHHCELTQENQVCIKHKKIHTYCNYYNFTIENAIEKKKLQGTHFQESQLVYIMGCLVDAALYLQKYGISVGQYTANSIFLSPQGFIKLFLLQIQQQNRHSCYYKVLSDRSLLQNYIFSPQQLQHLNNMQYQLKFDQFKSDLFSIAMVVLQLVTLDKSKFYYSQDKSELKIDRISFDISSMTKYYSQPFVNLLKGCLQPNPTYRLTIQQASQELAVIRKGMKNLTYCIRLQQDQQKGKKNGGKRQIAMSVKGQHILDGLQKKLTPSPIATLASSVSSQYHIESNKTSSRTSQSIRF